MDDIEVLLLLFFALILFFATDNASVLMQPYKEVISSQTETTEDSPT